MIRSHQPTLFGDRMTVALSSVADGNMRFGRGDDTTTLHNRQAWFESLGLAMDDTALVQVTYDSTDFARHATVRAEDAAKGMRMPQSDIIADALVLTASGQAAFLPLADCAGVVLYDTRQHIAMLSHIGRHSAEILGAQQSVEYLQTEFGSSAGDMLAWVSPAVGATTYPLHACDGRSLASEITRQLHVAGLHSHQIVVSPIDTAHDTRYYSHSEFQAARRVSDGRHAVVVRLN